VLLGYKDKRSEQCLFLHLSCSHHPRLVIPEAISHASEETVNSQRFGENWQLDCVQIVPVNYGEKEVDVYSLMVAAEGSDDSNPLATRVNQLFSKIQFVPRNKHTPSRLYTRESQMKTLKVRYKFEPQLDCLVS